MGALTKQLRGGAGNMTRAPAGVGMRLRLGRGVAPKLYGLVDAIIELVYARRQSLPVCVLRCTHARVHRLVTICPSMPLARRFLLFTCSLLPGVAVQPMPPREAGCLLPTPSWPAHTPQAGWHAAPAIPPAGRKRCQEEKSLRRQPAGPRAFTNSCPFSCHPRRYLPRSPPQPAHQRTHPFPLPRSIHGHARHRCRAVAAHR